MTLVVKPNYTKLWASGGAIVEPSDAKKQLGWAAEVPPHQWENWSQNRQDTMLAHINQRGVTEWDTLSNYEAGGLSYVQGSNGTLYKSVAASGPLSTVQNPTTDTTATYWIPALYGTGNVLSTLPLASLDVTTTPAGKWSYTGTSVGTKPTGSSANGSVDITRYSANIIKQVWTDVTGGSAIPPRTWTRTSYAVNTFGSWVESYTTSNVVGTASQTGGLPTGAIIEYTVIDALKHCIRYADGTQVVYASIVGATAAAITTPFFGGFVSTNLFGSSYAAKPFTVILSVVVNPLDSQSFGAVVDTITLTSASFRATSVTSQASSVSRNLQYVIYGRWF